MVSDADCAWVDIGVKNGREHLTLGRTPRIAACEDDLGDVHVRLDYLPVILDEKAADSILDFVAFRRVSRSLANNYVWTTLESLLNLPVIGPKSAQSNVHVITENPPKMLVTGSDEHVECDPESYSRPDAPFSSRYYHSGSFPAAT